MMVSIDFPPRHNNYPAKMDAPKTDRKASFQHACDMDAAN